MPLLPVFPAPPVGPSLAQLVAGLSTPTRLTYESSVPLSTVVSGFAGTPVVPVAGLDTTGAAPGTPAWGDRDSEPTTAYEFLHAMSETMRGQHVLPNPLSAYAAQWAALSHLWSFRPPPPGEDLRLSPYVTAVSGRLRAAWSELVGTATAVILLRHWAPTGSSLTIVDVDRGQLALAVGAGLLQHPVPAGAPSAHRPDLLAFVHNAGAVSEIVAVECKGDAGGRISGAHRLSDGVTQVATVGPGNVPLHRWIVCASCTNRSDGQWRPALVELPTPPPPLIGAPGDGNKVLLRAAAADVLRRVGDETLAVRLGDGAKRSAPEDEEPRATRRDDRGRDYVGRSLVLDAGRARVEVFFGLDVKLRKSLQDQDLPTFAALKAQREAEFRQERERGSGYAILHEREIPASISASGTLLEIAVTQEI